MNNYKISTSYSYHLLSYDEDLHEYLEFCKEHNIVFTDFVPNKPFVVTEEELIMIRLKYPTSSKFLKCHQTFKEAK